MLAGAGFPATTQPKGGRSMDFLCALLLRASLAAPPFPRQSRRGPHCGSLPVPRSPCAMEQTTMYVAVMVLLIGFLVGAVVLPGWMMGWLSWDAGI